jgi:hypothetical protein
MTRGEIVIDEQLVASLTQSLDNMTAYVAGSAGDEDFHRVYRFRV